MVAARITDRIQCQEQPVDADAVLGVEVLPVVTSAGRIRPWSSC